MNMRHLTSLTGPVGRVRRPQHDRHAAHGGHGKLEPLPTPQPGSLDDLHFGELIVPAADAIHGGRAEMDAAPEFTHSELRGRRNENKYMSIAPCSSALRGVVR